MLLFLYATYLYFHYIRMWPGHVLMRHPAITVLYYVFNSHERCWIMSLLNTVWWIINTVKLVRMQVSQYESKVGPWEHHYLSKLQVLSPILMDTALPAFKWLPWIVILVPPEIGPCDGTTRVKYGDWTHTDKCIQIISDFKDRTKESQCYLKKESCKKLFILIYSYSWLTTNVKALGDTARYSGRQSLTHTSTWDSCTR